MHNYMYTFKGLKIRKSLITLGANTEIRTILMQFYASAKHEPLIRLCDPKPVFFVNKDEPSRASPAEKLYRSHRPGEL